MCQFTGHEGQNTVIVRGAMHHAVMSETEFRAWLEYENCERGLWCHVGGTPVETCEIYRPDGSVRSMAMKISADAFEPVQR